MVSSVDMHDWLILSAPWARALLGLVFLLAAFSKLRSPAGFVSALGALGIERPTYRSSLRAGVPLAEIGLGIWLWTGWSPLFSALAAVLALVLLTAALVDLWRKGYEGTCGCFIGDSGPVGVSQILRNGILLALALWVGLGTYAASGPSATASGERLLLFAAVATALALGAYVRLTRRVPGSPAGAVDAEAATKPRGEAAPRIELTDLAGERVVVGRPEAEAQLVVFARGKCPGCLRDRDVLNRLPKSSTFETVIVCGGDPELTKEFAAGVEPPVRIAADPRWQTAVAWQVTTTPFSVLVDRQGRVRARGQLDSTLSLLTSRAGSEPPSPVAEGPPGTRAPDATSPSSPSSRQRYREFVESYRQGRPWSRGPKGRATEASDREPGAAGDAGSGAARDSSYLKQYARWIRPHWRTIVLVFVLSVLAEGLKMVEPLLMRFVVDHVLLDAGADASLKLRRLNVLGASFIGLVIVAQLIILFKDDRQRLMNLRVKVSLRRSLMERLLDLPLSRLAKMKTGGVLSRLTSDVDTTTGILQHGVVFPAVSVIRLLIAGGILLTLSWQLALTVLAALPGLAAVSFAMAKRVRPIYQSILKDAAEINGRAGEAFAGIRIVRAFHREAREILDYMRGQHTMLRKEMFAYRRELLLWLSWGLLLSGANVVILWYGGYLYLQGRVSVGDILAFQWYTLLMLGPVLSIVNSFSQLQRSQAATERIFEVLAMERDKPDRPGALEAPGVVREIGFEHVDFEYRKGRPVIHDLDLTVPGGSMVALVGRSGAGKTTITDLVGRFHDPTRGRITLNGTDIRDFRIRSYRGLFAIVQQHVFLFDGSVRENIAYGRPDASDFEVEDAARRANAHGFIEQLPEGYDTRVGERGVKLSGGQQQRLAIARAFLKAPAILIMDEATSNLDTESEQLIQASMAELMASRTTFVIAHRLSTIQQADLILVIDDGRIVEQGRHEELMQNRGEYRDMVVRQMIALGERSSKAVR